MYITALLMILIFAGAIYLKSGSCRSLKNFDINTTQTLRGLLALLIVSHHLGQRTAIPYVSGICGSIGLVVVAAFFFMSGYGLGYSYIRKGNAYMNGFLRKRLSKIVPLFLFLTLSIMVATQLASSTTIAEHLEAFAYNGKTPLPHSWFIFAIIYVYIVFRLSAFIGKTPVRTGFWFLGSCAVYVIFLSLVIDWPLYWYATIMTTSLGYFVGLYGKKIRQMLIRHCMVSYGLIVLALFLSFCIMCKIRVVPDLWIILWNIVEAFAIYVIVCTFGMIRWRPLLIVATFSLELYLIHGLPLKFWKVFIGVTNDYALWFLTFACAIPMAYVANLIFQPTVYKRAYNKVSAIVRN